MTTANGTAKVGSRSQVLTWKIGLAALLGGATGISFAPIWVRLSEVGPSATAFYRLFFALPWLWLWAVYEYRKPAPPPRPVSARDLWLLAAAGFFFAGDLAVWHWSIKLTSVANATLFANFAPIFVTLGAWLFLGQKVNLAFLVGMTVALIGGSLLAGVSLAKTARHLLGDGLGLVTALFYGSYLLTINHLRRAFSTGTIMAWSGLVTCPLLLVTTFASRESLVAQTTTGWMVLLALALTSQVAGQGLIAYASAHLSAPFLSVSLLFQPALAAFLAWVFLGEPVSLVQMLGGILVLAGIGLAAHNQK
jgi:drug/metabolite transporter (DMT)-like permease